MKLRWVRLLGETTAVDGVGATLPIGGPRRRAVLAFLALRAPRAATKSELIDALWGDDPPPTAVNTLQAHVSALRKALGPGAVDTVGDGYRLAARVEVDVAEFERLCQAGAQLMNHGESASAADSLRAGLALWRGRALADLGESAFARDEGGRLEEERLAALERRIEADLTAGRPDAVIAELEALVAEHPLREGLSGQLMRALYGTGRQADALSAYDVTRRRLRDELGLEPSPALRELHHRLLAQVEEPAAVTPPRKRLTPPPALLDETFGREEDLAALHRLITSGASRLICVVGPGGVGKTRLVAELGHRLAGMFRDGVGFAPLADAQAAADVAPTICAALGLRVGEDGAAATLENGMRDRQMLLVCDNFEHVVEAAPMLTRLLAAATGVRIVVTSRRQLGVRGEYRYRLDPLAHAATGGPPAPAVALFLARARAADPDFDQSPDELADIAAICAGCDGLPLAIELAAARTRVLTVAELRDRIAHPLPVLEAGPRDAPARHRTLRASIAWSVEALDPADEQFLADLSIFRGGFTVAAAAAVTGAHIDQAMERLDSLLGRSLVHRRAASGGQRRFDLLETIREYAGERINPGDGDRAQRRHAEFYNSMMGPVPDAGTAPYTTTDWAAQLPERPNLRVAIRWAREAGDSELFADLVNSAGGMWDRLGPRNELDEWLQQIVADPDTPPGRVVDALLRRAQLCVQAGSGGAAARLLAEAERLAAPVDGRRQAWVLTSLFFQAHRFGGQEGAGELLERLGRAVEAAGSPVELQAQLLMDVGIYAEMTGDRPGGLRAYDAVVELARSHHMYGIATTALNNACELALALGNFAKVIAWAEEGMRLAEAAEDVDAFAGLISQRGLARLETGDLDGAGGDLRTAVELNAQEGTLLYGLDDVLRLAALYSCRDEPRTAAALLGAFQAGIAALEVVEQPVMRQIQERHLANLPTRLGGAYDAALGEGRDLFTASGRSGVLAAILKALSALDATEDGQAEDRPGRHGTSGQPK